MNRRSFLRLLAAVPVLRHVPLPRRLYGDGALTIPGNEMLSPSWWKKCDEASWGGGGGGGGGAIIVMYTRGTLTVSANGGHSLAKGAGEV